MQSSSDLKSLLNRIDHRGYPAYKDTKGIYQFPGYILSIDHVQGDPFASPSRVSLRIPGKNAGFPKGLYQKSFQRIALQDYLTREYAKCAGHFAFRAKGSGKSGLISVSRCGQEVLERTVCSINPENGDISFRMEIGFPANGRTINARELEKILFDFVPQCINSALIYRNLDARTVKKVTDLAEDQHYIREKLPEMGLCAFVADGSILPRESGVSSRPMKDSIRFQSPAELKITIDLPHRGKITGMGVPKGVTLIVGGGYHGKSTLLKALELGVYDHIAGDGREYVITDRTAVKIRAEDGRSICNTDISMFINDLPNGKDTVRFCTEDASGSTSQAANVVESIEAGTSLLLIDEDTSATNFMVRDELMQRVIHREMEPITPFIERIRELYDHYGISTVIVAGSSGAYFHVADVIIQMERYVPKNITSYARKVAQEYPAVEMPSVPAAEPHFDRCPVSSPAFRKNERIKMKTMGKEAVVINKETIDLRYVEQIVDSEQTAALGYYMQYAQKYLMDGRKNLKEIAEELEQLTDRGTLSALCKNSNGIPFMAKPRVQEIFACFNRCRSLSIIGKGKYIPGRTGSKGEDK